MPKSRGGRIGMFFGGVGTGVLVLFLIIWAVNPSSIIPVTPVTPVPGFSLSVKDPLENAVLDGNDFDATLYGLDIGDDPLIPGSWVALSGVSQLDDISVNDFDDELYSDYWVLYNGTVLEDFFDDNEGTRTYGVREAHINEHGANALVSYATPTTGGAFNVFNSNTGAPINTATANITTAVNFTIVAASVPASETKMAYSAYTTRTGDLVAINFLMAFNETVILGDLAGVSGLTKSSPTTTSMVFSYSYQGATWKQFTFVWSDDAIVADTLEIDGPIVMRFGTTVI
jgi:hypothetical protein